MEPPGRGEAAEQGPRNPPGSIALIARLLGCGSCVRRRREGTGRTSGPGARYRPLTGGGGTSTQRQFTPLTHSSGASSINIYSPTQEQSSEQASLLSKAQERKSVDSHFSRSPELPQPSLPKGFQFIEDGDLESDVCPICLEPYDEENPRIDTYCKHHYHLSCIYEWIQRSRLCPVCNTRMRDSNGRRFLDG